jgi:hypothetical protein
MNESVRNANRPSGREPGHGDDRALRIEYERKRLLGNVFASAFAMLATWAMVVITIAHVGPAAAATGVPDLDAMLTRYSQVPWWASLLLVPAALVASAKFLGSLYRLQDGEPAFVLTPQGLRFRPSLLDERVRVPWSAIRKVKARRFKQHRSIVLTIDEIDRHVPRSGPFAALRRIARSGRGTITLTTPMSKAAWTDLAEILQRHVAEYGHPDDSTPSGDAQPRSAPLRRSSA